MYSEWCSEVLCFATEYSQFRESLNLSDKQKTLLGCAQADHSTLDARQFMRIVDMFYRKYIASGTATHEINVSYEVRLALAQVVEEYDAAAKHNLPRCIQSVVPVLEEALSEVLRLLQSAFTRFKLSAEWSQLCKELLLESKKLHTPNCKVKDQERGRAISEHTAASTSRGNKLKVEWGRFRSISAPGGSPGSMTNDGADGEESTVPTTTSVATMSPQTCEFDGMYGIPAGGVLQVASNTSADLVRVITDSK